ncbi:hypothetical protein VTK73DRAFT_5807 [Phialemonium thermophilum]|uniref:Uncharacterized protein n=1 Tax=Phialemonium thermophilum TaxID=223376 RepID=A0ABR3V0P9_9PEZI
MDSKMDSLVSALEFIFTPSPIVFGVGIAIIILVPIILHLLLARATPYTALPTVLLVGPSGAGKTALLTLFERVDEGIRRAAWPLLRRRTPPRSRPPSSSPSPRTAPPLSATTSTPRAASPRSSSSSTPRATASCATKPSRASPSLLLRAAARVEPSSARRTKPLTGPSWAVGASCAPWSLWSTPPRSLTIAPPPRWPRRASTSTTCC